MRILVVENFAGTPLGQVATALDEIGAEIDLRRMWAGGELSADVEAYSGLVVLGGEQSALDDADHPWLPHLAEMTRRFGEADKAVLGICLGAQLVARGHGATNILGRPVEFGWHHVEPTVAGRSDPVLSALGPGAPLFHWHLDTFTLPPGATHLARSAVTENQAFRIGRAVYGIQFHFEADRGLVHRWSLDFASVIATYAPHWEHAHPAKAAEHGPQADATGMAIARSWAALLR